MGTTDFLPCSYDVFTGFFIVSFRSPEKASNSTFQSMKEMKLMTKVNLHNEGFVPLVEIK